MENILTRTPTWRRRCRGLIQPGTVYEAREAGESKGLFTIRKAAADADKNWVATGMWDSAEAIAARAEAKRKAEEAKKAREAALKEQAKDTGPPKLKRGGGPDTTKPGSEAGPATTASTRTTIRTVRRCDAALLMSRRERRKSPRCRKRQIRMRLSSSAARRQKDSPLVNAPPPAPKQSPVQLSNNKLLAAISDATPDEDRSFLFPWKPEEAEAADQADERDGRGRACFRRRRRYHYHQPA